MIFFGCFFSGLFSGFSSGLFLGFFSGFTMILVYWFANSNDFIWYSRLYIVLNNLFIIPRWRIDSIRNNTPSIIMVITFSGMDKFLWNWLSAIRKDCEQKSEITRNLHWHFNHYVENLTISIAFLRFSGKVISYTVYLMPINSSPPLAYFGVSSRNLRAPNHGDAINEPN